ncbi:unnamed protein product [Arctia plantaginis]|uniref:DRBM domain-containing protein n=1 Tax=Arctia plantaginis TaxID=874455 RepID=A0A8S1A1U0_ARCPL|nr:unnamed protein product [Arctia plantaginis]
MESTTVCYWKRLWRWITSESLTKDELASILEKKEVIDGLSQGLASYKPHKPASFSQLQSKHTDQTKLLAVVQTIQNYINVDCFQIWEVIKNYLCDISYGTPANALKNVAFVDTRPVFLLPNVWTFYYSERLFLLKLLQYIIHFKNDPKNIHQEQFKKIIDEIGISNLKTSLLSQFEKLLNTPPPSRKIQNDFSNETIRKDWADYNLREQLAILQILLLIADEAMFTDVEFKKLFSLFRKHGFGKNQGYSELLEERHRDGCMRIMYMEVCIFMVIADSSKINNLSSWIDNTKDVVETELTKLHMSSEHSALLITWMMLTIQSEQHVKLFESQYQHYGATALRMQIFEFLQQMLDSSVFSDKSKCSLIARDRIFRLLNQLCDKFDGDATISHQPGIMQLCADLLASPEISAQFWKFHQRDENIGIVSLWNTGMEYFPFNFSALSILAAGLAESGKSSVRNLIAELKSLPVYTEIYNPNAVPIMSLQADDAIIGREYYPLGDPSYRIEVGSKATIMERKEGTMIHFRTPYCYWTVFNTEIEKALDRNQHHQHDVNVTLERIYEGTKVLKGILRALVHNGEVPKSLVGPSEGVFDVLVRFMRTDTPPLPLLVECISVCTALVPMFPKEIHLRLTNTGLLPRILNHKLSHIEYANGTSFDSAAVGSYLVTIEQPNGTYKFLEAYMDMLCAFHEVLDDDRITSDIILPGLVLILREVFPNVYGWRYSNTRERRNIIQRCAKFLTLVLQDVKRTSPTNKLLKKTCLYSLLHTENALELLKIISIGNEQLESIIRNEANWISGTGSQYISTIQRCVAIVIFALRLKTMVADGSDVTPLEHLIFAQNKQKDSLKVVPKVTSYINHAFNKSLPVLCCRLLKRFADGFQMSLFASLDMTAYQVRVMFLDRLRDEFETTELKVAILEFVATCVGTQPGLTEAFFMINHEKAKSDAQNEAKTDKVEKKKETDDSFEGILGYMADYLGTVKSDVKLLHSPLLSCIMALFHALWKNNMQILVKKLREHPKFWEHMTSPLFSEIQPELRTYAQIFNVLGIELFVSRDKLEPNLKEMLEQFFDTNKKHLDTWINYIFSFKGRSESEEMVEKVPVWLGLLTSWKDFITIFCKCLPISLNIAHKAKMVAPCMNALLTELDELKDGRLVVILSELYVIMLANWKEDCFDNRKMSAKQIDNLLTNTAIVYECLHPRAVRAILSICTVAISSLDYEIKANSSTAQSIIRSVTNINSLELEKLLDDIKDEPRQEANVNGHALNENIPPVVLSLAMLEQCLDLYDEMFTGLSQWFQSSRFINKLLCCLHTCLQNRRHYHTSLAALRCLTAYSRGPFSKDLLMSDIDEFLWLQLLPPKFDGNCAWKPQEWWRVYAYSLDFISMMVMKHGEFFASDAITFVGVHLDHLIEAVLLPRHVFNIDALNVCASTLNLVVQLIKFESRWRIQNITSLIGIMKSISACLYQSVTLMMRSRRSVDHALQPHEDTVTQAPNVLHRTLEILHMATLCLLSFSPELLSLLADPGLDLERWQPLVELHFGAPKISYEPFPQLTFGTLVTAICLLTRSLNHAYHSEEGSGSRSPRARRRACACASPAASAERRANRSESLTSISSAASLPALDERLVATALDATATLLASQALLAVRDPKVAVRHKQLIRRELSSELTMFHDFVRKRILCAAHARPHLVRNKLGAWPLTADEEETKRIEEARKERNPLCDENDDRSLPPPPPPKRPTHDSMREYILRKQYLDKCAQTPTKGPPSPVSHSTPTSDKKKETLRSSKRVSWAETTRDSDDNLDSSLQEIEPVYSNLTDVQINNDEDYFHFILKRWLVKMMHHPNMHHQTMSGHPPQHMGGHQGMPTHHQMPPHQMHRENRHVTLTRVPLGPGAAGGAMSAHGPSLGMGAAMGVPPPQRPPHPIRAMPHHPQAQHHSVPPQQMKPLRRPYAVGGGYGPSGGVMPSPYAQPPRMQPPAPQHPPQHTVPKPPIPQVTTSNAPSAASAPEKAGGDTSSAGATSGPPAPDADAAVQGDSEASRPATAQANSKEKTPMCLVNELARYNKIKHQYRLTSETGPAHKKVFTVTLRLGDTEEYTAEGSSIKRAQHCAASTALAATHFPPPPPRAPAPHAAAHPHHRHAGAVMPTVELNALAMKLCQPAIYTSVPPVAGPTRLVRRGPAFRTHALLAPAYAAPALLYRVRVAVGGNAWLGEGATPQAARHDAAARALHDLRPPPDRADTEPPHVDDQGDGSADLLSSEVKSPVSLVHELALKRNLSVQFTVKSERGPPHMRVFITVCTVGDMETEGEGNGKKVSKRRAAERMLDEMRRRWPPALLRARPPHDKRRPQPAKKKPRNLIKPEPTEGAANGGGSPGGADNPISRLAVARHAVRARSPQYRVLEERGAARRREFLVQCDAPPHSATGLGPNKKTAKRRAAHNVLLAMEMSAKTTDGVTAQISTDGSDVSGKVTGDNKSTNNSDSKRKETEGGASAAGGASADVRQPVPGVLLMDYHQRSGQPHQPNGVSESSATGGAGGNTPGATDQLMYLSQLLGFTVQFSDFPKRNHGEYLSLVSLSTEPPVMCHGGGPSTQHSHEQCSRAALRALALMGLDAPAHSLQTVGVSGAKASAVSNGIAE